jgi:hypothetical protein
LAVYGSPLHSEDLKCFVKSPHWRSLKDRFEKLFRHPRCSPTPDLSVESEISASTRQQEHEALVYLAENPFIKTEKIEEVEKKFNDRDLELDDVIKQSKHDLAAFNNEKREHEGQLAQDATAFRILRLSEFWHRKIKDLINLRAENKDQAQGNKYELYTALILKAMGSLDIIHERDLPLCADDRATLKNDQEEARACINEDEGIGGGSFRGAEDVDASLSIYPASSTMIEPEIDLEGHDFDNGNENPLNGTFEQYKSWRDRQERGTSTEFVTE